MNDLAVRADWLADRPETQEPEATEALYTNWQEPTFVAEAEASYYEPESPATPPNGSPQAAQALAIPIDCSDPYAIECVPDDPVAPGPPPPSEPAVLTYVKSVGWGTVDHYDHEYIFMSSGNTPFLNQLDWSRDGCSVPELITKARTNNLPITVAQGIINKYSERFRPACNVHDFGYRNIPRYQKTEGNRARTDDVFLGNMRDICHHRPWYQRPICRIAAWSFHKVVRAFGWLNWG